VTLHLALLTEMLEEEVAVARARLGDRIASLDIVGTDIMCRLAGTNVGAAILRFGAAEYDAEPMSFAVVTENGEIAEQAGWPGNLFHAIHPSLNRAVACIQGCYEYHTWPSHVGDRWDAHRTGLRFNHLLDHVARRAGK
jgi:hypothetical protein